MEKHATNTPPKALVCTQTLAHIHGLPTVISMTAAAHIAPSPLDGSGHGNVWSHQHGKYVPVRVAVVAQDENEFAASVMHVYRNETLWSLLSVNAAQFARSGGDGRGVCPSGMADDWLSFWGKLQFGACGSTL